MDTYQERLAPIFSQIILQKEYEQLQILRDTHESFRTRPYALAHLKHDYSAFDQAVRTFEELCSAHKRIRENRYGMCSSCGESIDLLRLNAHPATLHCLNCEYKRDSYTQRTAQSCT